MVAEGFEPTFYQLSTERCPVSYATLIKRSIFRMFYKYICNLQYRLFRNIYLLKFIGIPVSNCDIVVAQVDIPYKIKDQLHPDGDINVLPEPSIHSIKKAEYARRIAQGRLGHVTLFDHFKSVRPVLPLIATSPNLNRYATK